MQISLKNAVIAALAVGGTVGALAAEVREAADGKVQVAVAADGPGIPDEEKPKVSARFYRGDASRGTPGVGLGLTLVASVAKVHGGALELADNNPGLRANMIISVRSGGATSSLEPARIEGRDVDGFAGAAGPPGVAGAAHYTGAGATGGASVYTPTGSTSAAGSVDDAADPAVGTTVAAHNLRMRSVS